MARAKEMIFFICIFSSFRAKALFLCRIGHTILYEGKPKKFHEFEKKKEKKPGRAFALCRAEVDLRNFSAILMVLTASPISMVYSPGASTVMSIWTTRLEPLSFHQLWEAALLITATAAMSSAARTAA